MAKKLKFRIFAEWNRDGKFDKVGTERYDPDKISVVAIHEQEQFINDEGKRKWKPPVKKYEHIFIKDEEPDPVGRDPKIMFDDEDGLYQTEPGQDLAINSVITDPDGNDTIKEIVWLQMLGTACPFDVVPNSNNRSIVIHPSVEGDYAFSVTVTDATDRVATRVANVQVRVQVPVCGPNQHIDPTTGKCVDNDTEPEEPGEPPGEKWIPVVAGFGDCNSNSRSSQTFQNIKKLQCKVVSKGDHEYDGNFDDFKSIYILRDETVLAYKGNHDHTQSESSAIESANKAYWGWDSIATGKAKVGNIGLIAIDTQASASEQKQFVEAALLDFQSDPDVVFIVCGSHKPMYTATTKHSEEKEFRDVFQPLFDKYGVDIVTHGHNHNQSISFPVVTGKVKKFEKNTAGEYDFSKVHGQIYVTSGNAGESLYQIDSNPDYIQWSQDDDYGFMVLEQSQNNTKRLRISFRANSGQELHAVVIDKTGQVSPPTGNLPPEIHPEEMENTVGNVGEEISTGGKVTDPNGQDDIAEIKWATIESPAAVTFIESTDKSMITFKTDVAGVYKFRQTATDKAGLSVSQDYIVTMREQPTEPPEPTDNVILDTHRDTDLHDGKAGTMTKVLHKITGKLLGECRASGNPKIVKNADGTWSLVCNDGHGRVYWYVINFNTMLEIYMKFSPSVDSGTSKVRSLHNEPGDCEKRPGGHGQHMDFDEIGFKTEICHNNHESGKDFDYNPNIQAEKFFGMRYECKNINNDKEIQFTAWLDYMDGQGWKKVATHKHSSPKQSYMDRALHANNYLWCPRLNGAGKITVQSLVVKDLDK